MKNNFLKLAFAVLTMGLLGSCAKINERLDGLDKRIDGLENERIASIDKQIENINSSIADLGTIRSNIQSLTSTAASHGEDISDLQDADEALGERIDDLKKYVDDTLKGTTEWVKATFSTLEQYEATCDTIAKIDARLGATSEKLSQEIKTCADSLTNWVNKTFEGYYTAAEMDAKLAAMKAQIDTASQVKADSIKTELAKAKVEIDTAKAQITRQYTAAIASAIKTSEGKLTKALQDSIAAVNAKVAALTDKVTNLEIRVCDLTGRVDALAKMIQSIEFVPENSDRMIVVTYNDQSGTIDINRTTTFQDIVINYRVTPASVLDAIFKSDKTPDKSFKLYFKGVKLAETKAGEPDNRIAIDTVMRDKSDKELITVVVSKDELNRLPVRNCISDHTTLSLALGYANGATDFVGPYTDVRFKDFLESFKEDYENVYLQMAKLIGSKQPGTNYNPYRVLFNMCGDDVIAPNPDPNDLIVQLNNFSYNAYNKVIYNCYTNFYKAIEVCNKFIYKYYGPDYGFDLVGDIENSKQYLAEVRTLRAWLHFTLATGWQNPPLVTEYPTPDNLENCDYDYLLKWCLSELFDKNDEEKTVIDYLSERKDQSDKEGAYIVTKAFAQALTAKVAMFCGVDNNIELISGSSFNKEDAKGLLEGIIYSCKYSLPEVSNSYHATANGNIDKIFELNMEKYAGPGYVDAATVPYMGMETDLWGWNGEAFNYNALDRFYSERGGLVQGAGLCGIPSTFPAAENDIRFKIYCFSEDIWEYNDTIKAGGLYGQYKYYSPKQLICKDDLSPATGNRITNFTIMRYAEVLLLHAELSEYVGYINEIRAKAGLAPISNYNLDDLANEKERELWMEGCRWPDIVRWGNNKTKAFDILKKAGKDVPVLYDNLTREPKDGETPGYVDWDKRFYVLKTNKATEAGKTVGFQEKHKYFPFPSKVIAENPNLKQNPAWL